MPDHYAACARVDGVTGFVEDQLARVVVAELFVFLTVDPDRLHQAVAVYAELVAYVGVVAPECAGIDRSGIERQSQMNFCQIDAFGLQLRKRFRAHCIERRMIAVFVKAVVRHQFDAVDVLEFRVRESAEDGQIPKTERAVQLFALRHRQFEFFEKIAVMQIRDQIVRIFVVERNAVQTIIIDDFENVRDELIGAVGHCGVVPRFLIEPVSEEIFRSEYRRDDACLDGIAVCLQWLDGMRLRR